jgi:hypothetical protein
MASNVQRANVSSSTQGWNLLIQLKPQNIPKVNDFLQYFNNTWFTKFPPHVWNHHHTKTPRTYNHLEGFNISLSFQVEDCKPEK